MNQSNPSVILYGQALILLKQISDNYVAGDVKSIEDVALQLRDVLTKFEASSGRPLLSYDPFVDGEPPISSKMNTLWHNLTNDVNILQNQIDVLRAASVFAHNLITVEVLKATAENARVNNKLKTLQLYTDGIDNSIVTFGDNFHDDQFIDLTASLNIGVTDGMMTLGKRGDAENINSRLSIIDTSDGFAGNNQEIEDPNQALLSPVTNTKMYSFIAETNAADNLNAITDNQPNTWFEYEHILVSDSDKLTASNFNFSYAIDSKKIDWTTGPTDGVLRLGLQFDLSTLQNINSISYTPHGLKDNSNPPVLVEQVQISGNGTDWSVIAPSNVWIGTDPNLIAARTADNVIIGTAIWTFPSIPVQFIRILISQKQPRQTNVGHVYFLDKSNNARIEGPIPSLPIAAYYDPNNYTYGDTVQQREFFIGQRWAIGIRDINIQNVKYFTESTMVTKPLFVGGLVDRVSLEAQIDIPPDYPSDQNWISFFISPDNGTTWHQISRIQDDFLGIPEIIAYNDPLPEAFHEPGVFYYNVDKPVTSLRLKIQIDRPDDRVSSTPTVRSYKLKVRTR